MSTLDESLDPANEDAANEDTANEDTAEREASPFPGARIALIVFVVTELIAIPLLIDAGKRQWFFGDDWFFLVVTSYRTLFRVNTFGHWETIPIVIYHLLWQAFGLRNFTAYLTVAILLHLATAALVRTVMRRGGAGPWVSTITATMLVFLGSGASGILRPVQITFLGSLAFGLGQLLLADHAGKVDYRDALGLVCGLASLMCSNVGVAMVATVGLAVLLRRGWRPALLHTAPLALIYIVWWTRDAQSAHKLLGKRATIGDDAKFVWTGIRTTFRGIGHVPFVGLARGHARGRARGRLDAIHCRRAPPRGPGRRAARRRGDLHRQRRSPARERGDHAGIRPRLRVAPRLRERGDAAARARRRDLRARFVAGGTSDRWHSWCSSSACPATTARCETTGRSSPPASSAISSCSRTPPSCAT